MKAAAPAQFAAAGKERGELKLVIEGEDYHWEDKPAVVPGKRYARKKKRSAP